MERKQSLKILNIGNSFSNSLKVFLPDVVASAGCELQLEAASHGGCELHRHWKYISDEESDGVYSMYQDRRFKLREILAREQWDIVSIQQASHYSWKYETYQPYAKNIYDYIKRFAPNAEVVIQQTWAYRADDPRLLTSGLWGINQTEMYDRLTDAYRRLSADLGGLRIVPVGLAVQLARAKQEKPFENYSPSLLSTLRWPDLPPQAGSLVGSAAWKKDSEGKLFIRRDCIHLNKRGEFLQACVWFAKLYGRPVSEVTFKPDMIADDDIEFLKGIAQEAVDKGI